MAGKLEIWLINPKIARSAQELLRSVCLNCTTGSQIDVEVRVQEIRIEGATDIMHYVITRISVAPKVPPDSRLDTGSLATFVATEK